MGGRSLDQRFLLHDFAAEPAVSRGQLAESWQFDHIDIVDECNDAGAATKYEKRRSLQDRLFFLPTPIVYVRQSPGLLLAENGPSKMRIKSSNRLSN